MAPIVKPGSYPFLQGGGEMGELTRKYNWSGTRIGEPAEWPATLRVTVSNLLRSRFPMLLWWGEDLLQFYNDAYRVSLGQEGKHPAALGQKGKDCWQESWSIIYPLIKEVQISGESTWREDQLVPIYRNGTLQDVYWTFSYSAVLNEEGNTAGILVTCTETTEKVLTVKSLAENRNQLELAIDAAELATWDLDPFKNTFNGNQRLKLWFGVGGQDDVSLSLAIDCIAPKDRDRVTGAIKKSLEYQSRATNKIEFSIIDPLTGEERIVSANGKACFNNDNKGYRINGTLQDVTAETNARKKVAERESMLRALIETAPVAICVFSGRSLVIDICNEAFIHLIGKGYDILGKPLALVMPELEEQNTQVLQAFDDVFTSGKSHEAFGRKVNIVKNGVLTEGYYDSSYTPLFDASGHVYAILDIAVDVTEQFASNKRMEESEQQVRSLVESAPFPIGVYSGKEMRIILANQSILNAWGKGNDVVGRLYSEVLPELHNQEIFQQLDSVYSTGIAYHAKNQRLELVVDGKVQTYYFNYSFTPLFDANGKVYGVMNTAADVTDLNIANLTVEESRRNLRNMIIQAPVAMCILTGPEFSVEIANDRMFELWGHPKEEMMNRPIFDGLPEARQQGLEPLLEQVYNTGESFRAFERPVDLLRKGSIQTTYLNFVYQALKESNGVITGIMAVAVEVTELMLARQKIEEVVAIRTNELAEVNKALQLNNEELEQFAYIASHDLQEPLRKIRTFTEMLRNSLGELKHPSKTYLEKINTSAARMFQLIQDMLNFSQLTEDKKQFVSVDLNTVIENIRTDFEILIEQKQVELKVSKVPGIDAIPLQMLQLFTNLISNAIKFARSGTHPVINIDSSRLLDEDRKNFEGLSADVSYCVIKVSDNGIGFRQEYAEQIFKIFKRLHGKLEYAGTGIGLALCKKIAQNHKGDIRAVSAESAGSVFSIVLPEKQIAKAYRM